MKKRSSERLDLDVEKLIEMMNCALSEEWLAYYQYWTGAKVVQGFLRGDVASEMEEHAQEELSHAVKLVTRIIQLGGTPVLSPDQWMKMSRCRYDAPTDPNVEVILAQNLVGERCAIKRYEDIIEYTKGKDYATAKMATDILIEELEHEEDILAFQDDIESMKIAMDKALIAEKA